LCELQGFIAREEAVVDYSFVFAVIDTFQSTPVPRYPFHLAPGVLIESEPDRRTTTFSVRPEDTLFSKEGELLTSAERASRQWRPAYK
jgi:hypothetical protein